MEVINHLPSGTIIIIAAISFSLSGVFFGIIVRHVTKDIKIVLNRLDLFDMKIGIIDSWLYRKDNSEYKDFRDTEMKNKLEEDKKKNA